MLHIKQILLAAWLLSSLLLTPFSWVQAADRDNNIEYSFDHFSYAGPMAVFQLANDWHGDIKSGDDAISFIQNEVSVTVNHFTLSALSRTYHSFGIDNDLARGFYYYNNDITLDETLRLNASLDAKTYSGSGIRLGYEFTPSDHFNTLSSAGITINLTPSLVALRLNDIIWGELEGDLFYTSTKNWGGTIDVDYHYTKDHIARRPLSGDYIGQLYALDFEADIDTPWADFHYYGINVYGKIYWDGVPTTTAQVSTETAFLLFGYEYYDDVILDPPALHFIETVIPFGLIAANNSRWGNVYWKTDARITPIKNFYYHGLQWQQTINWFGQAQIAKAALQYDFSNKTPKISLELPNFALIFASQTPDVSKSQSLIAKLALSISF